MNGTIGYECSLFLKAILTGAGFSFLYDQFLVSRKLFKHKKIIICIEDFIYLLFCFFISFSLLYYGNDGVLRFYMIIGCSLGIVLYFTTIGRVYQRAICRIFAAIMLPCTWVKKRLTLYANQFTMKMSKCVKKFIRKGEEHARKFIKNKIKTKVSQKKK